MDERNWRIKNKVTKVNEFSVTDVTIEKVIKRRKNWTAPGIDGIQNFWWKMFSSTWRPMSKAMNAWVEDQATIPEWIAIVQTVLV